LEFIGREVDRVLKAHPGNLTTFAKGSGAWGKMKSDVSLPGLGKIEDYLWSADERKEFESDSRDTARIDNELQMEMKVRLLTAENWQAIKTLIIEMDEATDTKISLLNRAITGSNLSDKQCAALAVLVRQYEEIKGEIAIGN
jgi:hypothetical protein